MLNKNTDVTVRKKKSISSLCVSKYTYGLDKRQRRLNIKRSLGVKNMTSTAIGMCLQCHW